jgi:hypothetical protein
MRKPVSVAVYLTELNRRLQKHPDYQPGMKFTLHGKRGFNWETKGDLRPFVDVSAEVRSQFVVYEWRDRDDWSTDR